MPDSKYISLTCIFKQLPTLRYLDKVTRRYVRNWVHLSSETPLPMFYAPVGDGGLGIQCLDYTGCRLRRDRIQRLKRSDDAVVRALMEGLQSQHLVKRLTKVRQLGCYQQKDGETSMADGTPWSCRWERAVVDGQHPRDSPMDTGPLFPN